MAGAETAQDWTRLAHGLDRVLLGFWRLLGSLGFALVMLGFLALAGLLSILLPQVPAQIENSPAAVAAWVEFQKGKFGPLTEPMFRLGLFDVFASRWFIATLGLLAVAVFAYIVSRLPQFWQNIARPQERVPDSFFDRAANRVAFATPEQAQEGEAASRLADLLAARRYKVSAVRQGATTYLFADRFAWAQVGNLITHLAVIIFLVGGLTSSLGGFTSALIIAEGTASPVFAVSDPNQMQVEVIDAVGLFDERGTPADYRTELVIYQGGGEVKRGVVTVNDPLTFGGYRFHQSAFFGEGAALVVRDAASGNALYREVLVLQDLVPAPLITVRDVDGLVLLDDVIVPTDVIAGASGTLITVPDDGRQFWVGVKQDANEVWNLVVFGRDETNVRTTIPEGGTGSAGDLQFAFLETTGLPSASAGGIPGDNDQSLVVMSETPEGEPFLTLLGPVDGRALTLYADQSVQIDDREYLFEGRREFAGIEVRRDPGAMFIWVGAGLLLLGLMITFYVPRMRLWARVRQDATIIVGPAERSGVFDAEARRIARELGAKDEEDDVRQESSD